MCDERCKGCQSCFLDELTLEEYDAILDTYDPDAYEEEDDENIS